MCVYVCVCLCVCVCVCTVRPLTLKASSVCFIRIAMEQINYVVLKTFLSSVKSLHRYSGMKYQTFLTSHVILFTN